MRFLCATRTTPCPVAAAQVLKTHDDSWDMAVLTHTLTNRR
jgi:hypothetical protein